MVQLLRTLHPLAEYLSLSLILSSHMADRNAPYSSSMGCGALFWPLQESGMHMVHIHTFQVDVHTHKIKINLLEKKKNDVHT